MRRLSILVPVLAACACQPATTNLETNGHQPPSLYRTIGEIDVPYGYERMPADSNSFAYWLRKISLKKDDRVYLYNGKLKTNQDAQFAILDMPVGEKDLQQCADAVMRLRAEYLFAQKKFSSIAFYDNNGKEYRWQGNNNRALFEQYLEKVFGWCGSASLAKQLKPAAWKDLGPGDVLIKGGFPGHAMLVVDVAINSRGKKMFMLAQSYMPAQDIHIVRNPTNEKWNPWYETGENGIIITPEWTFHTGQLKSW